MSNATGQRGPARAGNRKNETHQTSWGTTMKNVKLSRAQRTAAREGLNRFLSVLLSLAMVLQTSPVAYARMEDEGAAPAAVEQAAPEQEPAPAPEPEPAPAPEPEPEPQVEEQAEPVAETPVAVETPAVDETTDVVAEEPTEAEEPEAMATISVYVENATLTIGGQTLTNAQGTLSTPEGKATSFTVRAADGYELKDDSVKLSLNGKETVLRGNGSYTLSAGQVKNGATITVTPEKVDTETVYKYEDANIRVVATLDKATAIPDDAVLSVTPIYENSRYYNYDAYMDALNDRVSGEDVYDSNNTLLYDVAFLYVDESGKTVEMQPEEGAVTVKFSFKKRQLSEGLEAGSAANVEVNHLPLADSAKADTTYKSTNISADDVYVERMGANATGANTVEVRAKSFSVFAFSYTVDFTYDGYTLKLEGNGSIKLSQILSILNIPVNMADIAAVDFTNYDLLSFEKQGDDWKVTSLRSFVTPETLTITLTNGDKYMIEVTDPVESSSLADFLTNAVITGATQNADGAYEVEQGKDYSIILSFAENSNFQFDNDATLTYRMPTGIAVINEQSGPLKINIVYKNRTYEVDATFHLDTDGNLTVKFDGSDPDYHRLEESTNVSFRFAYDAQFDSSETHIRFNELIERDIIFDEPEPAQAYTNKTATFDKTTGTFNYTITVSATGDVTNVNVKDVITGNALIFNNDVRVTGNSSSYTDNGASNGFNYTFASMREGETITITYSAGVDFSKDTDKDGKITVDQTKNTVTVKPDGGDPHNSEYSHEINFKSTAKSDGTETGTTADGDKIIEWTIDYNPLALAPAGGDIIRDIISAGSTEYMKYYGDGITIVVRDHNGNIVRTDTPSYDSMVAHSDSSWTYKIPEEDTTPYSYHITYQTVVDMEKVNGGGVVVSLNNTANGDGGGVNVGPTAEIGVKKDVESFTTEEVTWVSTFNIPEAGLTQAVVTDTLPAIWLNGRNHYDLLKDGTLEITGLLSGESYTVDTSETGKVKITFFKDAAKQQKGLQGTPGGHTITVRLTTLVDQEWLQKGYETGGYEQQHTNTIDLNGKSDQATVIFGKPGIEKKGEKIESADGVSFKYTVVLSGVSDTPVSVLDTFDTSLLEVDTSKASAWDHMRIWGGNQWSQDAGHLPVSYTDTNDGVVLTANALPMQPDGHYYPYYKIVYYLRLKPGVDLEQLAIANGGEYDLKNTATWGDHESEFNYKVKYEYLDKKLLNAGELGGTNRTAQYRITFNSAKATLNGGEPMVMTDTLSKNLSIDYSSIQITTDPAGAPVPYSLSGGEGGTTVATYTVPDSTKVVITYDAQVVGNGPQKIVNKVSVNGKEDTIENTKDYGVAGEGEGAIASFKIVKVDGYDANKKLEGVKFKIFAENPTLDFGENADYAKEIILTTDENGEITLDGDAYDFYFNERYHVREIEPLPDYGTIGFDYLVTLTTDMSQVDYGHYIYYYNNTMQIKNWPLEGLVVEKQVKSDDAADLDKYFTFRISILNDDGITVNTGYNEKNGDDQFENGVVEFQLKNREQKMFWGFEKGTKYKVEEILSDADGKKYATTVDYDIYNEEGEIVDHETEPGTSHSGELTQSDETIVFTNSVDSKGGLKVTKAVTGAPSSASSKKYRFTVSDGTKWLDDGGNIVDGETWIEIADGETYTVAADKLPAGSVWTVTEDTDDAQIADYALDASSVPADGKVTVVAGKNDATVALKNDYTQEKGGLKVTKAVTGAPSSASSKRFKFSVSDGTKWLDAGGNIVDGETWIEIADGETYEVAADKLPAGSEWTVTEDTEGAKIDNYALSATRVPADGKVTVVAGKNDATVALKNDYTQEKGGLKVTKRVVSARSDDLTRSFTFNVSLSDTTISGTYGDMNFTSGHTTFALSNGQSKTAENLPAGVTYTVYEIADDDFTTEIEGEVEANITKDVTAEVTFTNTRETGDLTLSKELISDAAADKDQVFTFTVALSDNTISGTYGDMRFIDGVATVTLKGGESKTATGLPTGITYTITEASATGFKLTGITVDGDKAEAGEGTITKSASTVEFENTRETGELDVTKIVKSSTASDKQKDFSFRVTLTGLDATTDGYTYGGVTFAKNADGAYVGTFTLKDGEKKSFDELPVGIRYEVEEETEEGWTTTKTGETGSVSATKATAVFTNSKVEGGLVVSKSVTSPLPADKDKKFDFTVTLSDPAIEGTYGDMTFEAGVAEFQLADGESASAEGLPEGVGFKVEEADAADFTTETSGTIEGNITKDATPAAEFENTRETGDLTLSKELISDAAADKDQVFTFTVTLSDKTISGTYGDMGFENGVATVTLKGGESKTATGLPTGITYTITEASATGFKLTGITVDGDKAEAGEGTITKSASTVVFENTRETGGLTLSKELISSAAADKDQVFTFTVTLSDETISGTYGDMGFENGVATVTLKGGEDAKAEGLPTGIAYTITEASATGFELTGITVGADDQTEAGKATGAISKTASTVEFENTRETGDLTLSKELISSAAADKDQVFTFTVALSDETISGTYGDMGFENGVATVTLKGGEDAKAEGLPTGIAYTITEASATGFELTGITVGADDQTEAGKATGAISKTASTVEFENTRETGDLDVTKTVTGGTASDKTKDFSFTVTLSDTTINGEYGGMTFTDGVATFTLKDGGSKSATDLPTGITYEVEEETADGFVTTKTGETGTISKTKSTAAFTNYKPDKPRSDKKVADINDSTDARHGDWQESADYDIGDDVPFKLTATLANDVTKYKTYHITFVDQMEPSLTNNKDYKVTVIGKDGSIITGYKTERIQDEDHAFKLKLTWTGEGGATISNEALNGATVEVEFSARLNNSAVLGKTGNINGSQLLYSNKPDSVDDHEEGNTNWEYTIVFTYKVDINKVDENDDPLTGAQFTLSKVDANNTKSVVQTYTVKGTDPAFSFEGLDDGTYVLHETVAPAGCKKIDDIVFTVTANHNTVWANTESIAWLSFLPDSVTPVRTTILTGLTGNVTDGDLTLASTTDLKGLSGNVENTLLGKLEITKNVKINGADAQTAEEKAQLNGTYHFILKDSKGNPVKDADGNEIKPEITITNGVSNTVTVNDLEAGTYIVSEDVAKNPTGMHLLGDNDVEVVVEEGMDENGAAKVATVEFTNDFTSVKKQLEVTKEIDGRDWTDSDSFTFKLEPVNGAPMPKGTDGNTLTELTADATKANDKVAKFDELEFKATGAYQYTITEVVPGDAKNAAGTKYSEATDDEKAAGGFVLNGVTYNGDAHTAIVTVSSSNGKLTASVTYDSEESLTVTNEYDAKGTAQLFATKTLEVIGDNSKVLKAGDFTFELYKGDKAEGTPIQSVKNGAPNDKGVATAVFNAIEFELADLDGKTSKDFTYTIAERIPDDAVDNGDGTSTLDGMTFDTTTYTVTLTVTDNGNGTLSVTYDGKDTFAGAAFENSYFEAAANVQFNKAFYGASDGIATFKMTPADESGTKLNEAGTTTISGDAAYVHSEDTNLSWTETLKAKETTAVKSPSITFNEPGTYYYLIEETECTNTSDNDESVILAKIVIGEDGKVKPVTYQLKPYEGAEFEAVSGDDVTFYNNGLVAMAFRSAAMRRANNVAKITAYQPEIRKVLENGDLSKYKFTFNLYQGDTLISTAENDDNGLVQFDAIKYEEPGTYTYTIKEVAGSNDTIHYSEEEITLVVEVGTKVSAIDQAVKSVGPIMTTAGTAAASDGDNSAADLVVTSVKYSKDGKELGEDEVPTITNVFKHVRIHAVKYSRGYNADGSIRLDEPLVGAHYGLWMLNPNGNDVYLGSDESDANGNLYYDVPTIEGVVYYFKEEEPPPAGHLVDPYPTDYFTLDIGNEFSLKYFSSYDEAVSYANSANNG